jgi:heme/copper-type cytochrome/quinol oxidase subunit 2
VTVPNEGDVVVSQDIAVPEVQASAHPTGSGSYRQFALNMDGDAFTPNTVAVHKGDIVDLEVTATDKNYDFTQPDYGFNTIAIAQGATQKVQFQAVNTGKFTFYCSSCGGPAKGPVGYMIVTAD